MLTCLPNAVPMSGAQLVEQVIKYGQTEHTVEEPVLAPGHD